MVKKLFKKKIEKRTQHKKNSLKKNKLPVNDGQKATSKNDEQKRKRYTTQKKKKNSMDEAFYPPWNPKPGLSDVSLHDSRGVPPRQPHRPRCLRWKSGRPFVGAKNKPRGPPVNTHSLCVFVFVVFWF